MSEVKTLDFGFRQAARRNYTQVAGIELLLIHCCTASLFCTDNGKISAFTLVLLQCVHTGHKKNINTEVLQNWYNLRRIPY